jgi:diguanylate cyclase (GGDEF)-like protein
MDYGTFFFTNIASVTVFTACITLIALYERRVVGMRWFAAGLIAGLVKLILQGLEGKIPSVGIMAANELYLISFSMQLMGLRWFVVRQPLQRRWPWILLGFFLAAYSVLYLLKIPYAGNVMNIPFVAVCGASAWILFRHGNGPFAAPARTYAVVLCAEMGVAAYRAILTNLSYALPGETVDAQADPRWLYSLAAGAFLAAIMVMCDLWLLVVELQRELAEQATTDPLTGALNRRAMEAAAQRETSRSLRQNDPLSMIVIDIDNFKYLNDTRGHAAGDRALQALVCRAKSMLRTQDLFARTGGEEFAILLPGSPASAGIAAAERVRQAIEGLEVPFDGGPIQITISAGVAQLDSDCKDWECLMRKADAAMYDAKKIGRNSVAARAQSTPANATTAE